MDQQFAQQQRSAANAIAQEERAARNMFQNVARQETADGRILQNLAKMSHAAALHHKKGGHHGQPEVHSESSSFESSYVDDGHGAHGQEQKVSCVDGDCMKVSEVMNPAHGDHKKDGSTHASNHQADADKHIR